MAIKFKKPVKENAYVTFHLTPQEIDQIKKDILAKKEINLHKDITITNTQETVVFATVSKIIYIADKQYYKEKRKRKVGKIYNKKKLVLGVTKRSGFPLYLFK